MKEKRFLQTEIQTYFEEEKKELEGPHPLCINTKRATESLGEMLEISATQSVVLTVAELLPVYPEYAQKLGVSI